MTKIKAINATIIPLWLMCPPVCLQLQYLNDPISMELNLKPDCDLIKQYKSGINCLRLQSFSNCI